jgi:Ca-activated chloride channel family protein
MRLHKGRILAVAAVAIAAAWTASAENPAPAGLEFRTDSTLVVVPVTVVDRNGAIVNGLADNAFTLTEDGVQQQIRSFSEEEAPVSMGIVLDVSGSMARVLGAAKESLRALMTDANPDDEAFLNGVSTRPRAYSGFTGGFEDIVRRLESETAYGDTALIDTIYGSLGQLRAGVHPRKALVVISDGIDNHSRHTSGELMRLAVETDAQIYTIGVSEGAPRTKGLEFAEVMQGLSFLRELASRTGGISFVVRDGTNIAKAAAMIGRALRTQYVVGYAPRDSRGNGQWRKIGVKVAGQGLRAYARTGCWPDDSVSDFMHSSRLPFHTFMRRESEEDSK